MPAHKPMQDSDFRIIRGEEVGISESPSIYSPDGTPYGDPQSWGTYVIRDRNAKGDISGYSCLGFDLCMARIERYVQWLTAHSGEAPMPAMKRGSFEAYDYYKYLVERMRAVSEFNKVRCDADLTPQLKGLEGKRVEVVDMHDATRRFRVGRSTGWLPRHLEMRGRSYGGIPADLAYKSVRVI